MCFGRKSSSPKPAPVTPQPSPDRVADTSNDAMRQQVVAATAPQPQTFGAELGNPQQMTGM